MIIIASSYNYVYKTIAQSRIYPSQFNSAAVQLLCAYPDTSAHPDEGDIPMTGNSLGGGLQERDNGLHIITMHNARMPTFLLFI